VGLQCAALCKTAYATKLFPNLSRD
jgi:hypothetical protein